MLAPCFVHDFGPDYGFQLLGFGVYRKASRLYFGKLEAVVGYRTHLEHAKINDQIVGSVPPLVDGGILSYNVPMISYSLWNMTVKMMRILSQNYQH
jgi:hypothetical protein